MMDSHITEFNKYLNNTYVTAWEKLCREYGTLRSYKSGEEFITVGETARYIGFIRQGSAKYVAYTPDGQDRVIGFETTGGYVASYPYCLRGLPSIWSVVINSDAEIYCLPVQKIIELSRSDESVKQISELALEAVFYMLYERYVDFRTLTPKERYRQLLHKCPKLFEIFQLKDIASYLNITRQHLGRLRADL